eukprot:GCRY01006093.1.p1 GENE.GCRY01006093.1~~GCRY01006093.1.p1  ORF type:complete len:390 (+),score=67.34 GCRY01006093.1:149-1318(+)
MQQGQDWNALASQWMKQNNPQGYELQNQFFQQQQQQNGGSQVHPQEQHIPNASTEEQYASILAQHNQYEKQQEFEHQHQWNAQQTPAPQYHTGGAASPPQYFSNQNPQNFPTSSNPSAPMNYDPSYFQNREQQPPYQNYNQPHFSQNYNAPLISQNYQAPPQNYAPPAHFNPNPSSMWSTQQGAPAQPLISHPSQPAMSVPAQGNFLPEQSYPLNEQAMQLPNEFVPPLPNYPQAFAGQPPFAIPPNTELNYATLSMLEQQNKDKKIPSWLKEAIEKKKADTEKGEAKGNPAVASIPPEVPTQSTSAPAAAIAWYQFLEGPRSPSPVPETDFYAGMARASNPLLAPASKFSAKELAEAKKVVLNDVIRKSLTQVLLSVTDSILRTRFCL